MKKLYLLLISVVILAGAFYFFWLTPKYTVPILMYHNIGYDKNSFFVTPDNFARQMEYIKRHGYEVISLDELARSIKEKRMLKRNKVVITFDDGYKDNFEYAYPVLRKFGYPATIFLITNFIDRSSIRALKRFLNWDEAMALSKGKISFGGRTYIFRINDLAITEEKKFLSWDEVIIMHKGGISFGGHTKTHFDLGVIEDEEAALEEIEGSKKAIEDRIGAPADYFCYPGGGFNERAKQMLIQAGYKGACTTNRGFAKFNSDVYELKRIKVTNSDMNKPFSFWAKLSGYYTIFKRERNPY